MFPGLFICGGSYAAWDPVRPSHGHQGRNRDIMYYSRLCFTGMAFIVCRLKALTGFLSGFYAVIV